MQCFVGGRRTGKTYKLLQLSKDTGLPILVPTNEQAKIVSAMGERMGFFPKVISARGLIYENPRLMRDGRFLVDEIGLFIEQILGIDVVGATINGTSIECNPVAKEPLDMSDMSLLQVIGSWVKSKW